MSYLASLLKYQPPIVWSVIGLHLLWAALIASGGAYNTTGVGSLMLVLDYRWLAVSILIFTAVLSMIGLLWRLPAKARALCLFPQNILMACVSVGVLWFAFHGHYSDGTERSLLFIFADQLPYITMFLSHTVALTQWTRWL